MSGKYIDMGVGGLLMSGKYIEYVVVTGAPCADGSGKCGTMVVAFTLLIWSATL
jgi:hypothetical protein